MNVADTPARAALLLALACCAPGGEVASVTPAGPGDPPAGVPTEEPTAEPTVPSEPRRGAENVLLVLLDDVGLDKLGLTAEFTEPPNTPVIDALGAEGVLFRNAYASAKCSPARASLVTGRHARRTHIGGLVELDDPYWLDGDEVGIAEMLDASPHGYTTSMAGKWHLGSAHAGEDVAAHPAGLGWDWYAGSLENLNVGHELPSGGYFSWEKNTNGVLARDEDYATTDTVDDAIARVRAMPEPWLMYVAFNAGHEPLHKPPGALHTNEAVRTMPDPPGWELLSAMVEALDTELGRLLASLPPDVRARTTIVVLSDNGTDPDTVLPPLDPLRAKGTPYEGGVRVPFIVAGPRVARPGSVSDALVHVVDVFATVADIAEVPLTGPGSPVQVPVDGISLLPWLADPDAPGGHEYLLTEKFFPNGPFPEQSSQRAIRDHEWKLIRTVDPRLNGDMLFRLVEGAVDEGPDLLAGSDPLTAEEAEAHARLSAALDAHLAAFAAGAPL